VLVDRTSRFSGSSSNQQQQATQMAYRSLQAHHVQMGTLAHRTHAVLPRLSPCNRSWTRGLPRQLGRTVKTALGEPLLAIQHLLSPGQRLLTSITPPAVEAPVATAPLVASDTQPKVPSEQLDSSSDKFDWFAAWYPVAALDTLKPDRPTKVQLLGQDFVVWRDNQGEWQAFEDACPHRWVHQVTTACPPMLSIPPQWLCLLWPNLLCGHVAGSCQLATPPMVPHAYLGRLPRSCRGLQATLRSVVLLQSCAWQTHRPGPVCYMDYMGLNVNLLG
jgi:hypothetical protein